MHPSLTPLVRQELFVSTVESRVMLPPCASVSASMDIKADLVPDPGLRPFGFGSSPRPGQSQGPSLWLSLFHFVAYLQRLFSI